MILNLSAFLGLVVVSVPFPSTAAIILLCWTRHPLKPMLYALNALNLCFKFRASDFWKLKAGLCNVLKYCSYCFSARHSGGILFLKMAKNIFFLAFGPGIT